MSLFLFCKNGQNNRCKIKNNVFSSKSGIVRYLVTRFHFCSIHSIHFRETLKRGRNFFSWKRVFHVGNVIFFFFFLFWYSRKFVNSVGRKFEKKRTRYEIKRKKIAIVRTRDVPYSFLLFPFLSFPFFIAPLPCQKFQKYRPRKDEQVGNVN